MTPLILNKFGLYALGGCLGGAVLPVLMLLTLDKPDEFFGSLVITLILIFFQIIAMVFGILSWRTARGKIGIGLSLFFIVAIFFLFMFSDVPVDKSKELNQPQPTPVRRVIRR